MPLTFYPPPTSVSAKNSMQLRGTGVRNDTAFFLGVLQTVNYTWQVTLSITAASKSPKGWLQKRAFWLVHLTRSDEQMELEVSVAMEAGSADLTIDSLLASLQEPNSELFKMGYESLMRAIASAVR